MYESRQERIEQSERESDAIGLWYDSERLMLLGVYHDEVTAYRARRRWIDALEKNFLLDERQDFAVKVRPAHGGRTFKVRCDFMSACGRYAFWRLTNHQAPEVQFLLETAHLPQLGLEDLEKFADFHESRIPVYSESQRAAQSRPSVSTKSGLSQALRRVGSMTRRLFEGVFSRSSSLT